MTTPTDAHEDIILKSLSAGKAVFSEKPISESIEGTKRQNEILPRTFSQITWKIFLCARCYEMAREMGRPLFCAFNRRFDPSMESVRERVRGGQSQWGGERLRLT